MIEILKPSEYRTRPWKNGGGVTAEIAADAEASPPAWRLSLATIERDGPFSDFRGYDRTIVALDDGVRLVVDGEEIELRRHEPFAFRGESTVQAHVTGRTQDVNVMTQRAEFTHDVEILRTAQRYLVDDDELVFAYVLCGEAKVEDLQCAAGETAYLDELERFDIVPGADSAVCVIHITPR